LVAVAVPTITETQQLLVVPVVVELAQPIVGEGLVQRANPGKALPVEMDTPIEAAAAAAALDRQVATAETRASQLKAQQV
jgi:hypothetical protein